jgi:S1-C subfamily serine protease
MNPIPQRIFNLIILGLVAGIILLAVGARWYIDSLEVARSYRDAERQSETTAQLQRVREEVAGLTYITNALVAANSSVARQLASEQAKRVAAEQARAADAARAQQQIAALQQDISSAQTPNLANVISGWRPRVAQIVCTWHLASGYIQESSGSGVLILGGSEPTVVTNRHVVATDTRTANSCSLKFPDDQISLNVSQDDITLSTAASDWALIKLRTPTSYIKLLAAGTAVRCTSKPAIGESIVILGYPSVGAQGDVTATEGIISGFEGNYFISSAKVERGNSGGAAILTKQNCYLGIPSYVGAGQIESLARILDQRVIFK